MIAQQAAGRPQGNYVKKQEMCCKEKSLPSYQFSGGEMIGGRGRNLANKKKREITQLLTGTFVRFEALGARSSYYAHLSYEP